MQHFHLCSSRSLSLMTGKSCATSWTHWPQTATSTEPRQTRGSSGQFSGMSSRLLRWVWESTLVRLGFIYVFSTVSVCGRCSSHRRLYSSRRVNSSLRPFALGQSAWQLIAGSERGHTMPSGSLWALGWTTTYRYPFFNKLSNIDGVWNA